MMPVLHENPRWLAATAGLLYLIIIVCGMSAEVLIRGPLLDAADAAVTARNIVAQEALFRTGLLLDVLMLFADVALAVLLYYLLRPVNRTLSLLAAVFRLLQAALLAFNLLHYHAALLVLNSAALLQVFSAEQSNALASLLLDLHRHGYDLGLLFFAVSNLLLGVLLIRAVWIPALLGYGLLAAALVYLAGGLTRFLLPALLLLLEPAYLLPLLAETAFCLWLLRQACPLHAQRAPAG